jgi:hypothetical protein
MIKTIYKANLIEGEYPEYLKIKFMNIKSKLFFFIVFCFLSLNSYSQGWIKIVSYKKNGTITYLNDSYESYQNDIVTIWEMVEYEVFVYNNKNTPTVSLLHCINLI